MEGIAREQSAGDAPINNSCSHSRSASTSASTAATSSNGDVLHIEDTLAENILLKKELCDKLEQIINLKTKLTAVFERSDRNDSFDFRLPNLELAQQYLAGHDNGEIQMSNSSLALSNFPGIVDETMNRTFSLSESVIEWVEENKDEVIQKVGTGSICAKELLLGGLCGWGTAFILKKFGKVAVTALGGGLLLLQLANHKGYIVVNWSQIYTQLEKTSEGEEPEEEEWLSRKIKSVRNWSRGNTYSVVGFITGFLYKTYA